MAGSAQRPRCAPSCPGGGHTNLSDGLRLGLEEISASDTSASAVMLFTDGHANRGATGADELVQLVDVVVSSSVGTKSRSRAVFTFGFGTDHDARVLSALAQAGRGRYYYIDTLSTIGPAFADCLGGLMAIGAQDARLTLELEGGARFGQVRSDVPVLLSDDRLSLCADVHDLAADSECVVLFALSHANLPELYFFLFLRLGTGER